MAVVVNEFEVVNAPQPGGTAPAQAAEVQSPSSVPDPLKAEEEFERALRHQHLRQSRLHAT